MNPSISQVISAADAVHISVEQAARFVALLMPDMPAIPVPDGDSMAKAADEAWGAVLKADDEHRVALFVAYPVNKADVGVAVDGHIDFASPQAVEKAAWNWLAKGGRLGVLHQASTDEYEVVESGIHHGPDWVTKAVDGTERRIVDGDWLVSVRGKTPGAWQLIKAGLYGGTSPQGTGKRRVPSADALAALRS